MVANLHQNTEAILELDYCSGSDSDLEFDDEENDTGVFLEKDPLDREQEFVVTDDNQQTEVSDEDEKNDLLSIFSFLELESPEFQWGNNDSIHCIPGFRPNGEPGPTRKCHPGDQASSYFNMFFDDNLLQRIVDFTNANAKAKIIQKKDQTRNEDSKKKNEEWTDITLTELKAFIGVLMLIELLYKDRLECLWSCSERWPLITMTGLTQVFPRDRYMQISRYLHFCSEENVPQRISADYDKLYKVQPLMEHLTRKFQEEYVPEQNMSVDECMVPFRGRLSFKQYCKDKPVKFGVKVFMLAEAQTGYNFNFEVYTGADSFINIGLCSRVVISLSQTLFDKGYHIYTDRFYTSPMLLYYLSLIGLGGCGTVLPNRKHFPKQLYRTNSEINRGEFEWMECDNTGLVATVWCDRKPIHFLSSVHVPFYDGLEVKRKDGKGSTVEVTAPPTVVEYNKHMGGVDMNDRFCSLDKSRKQYKWYWRLFRKGLQWSLYNAYIIEGHFVSHQSQGARKRDFRSFYLDVAHQLIGGFTARRKIGRPSVSTTNLKRITESDHFPVVCESKNMRCVVCEEKHRRQKGKRIKTTFLCTSANCGVPLCIKACSTCWVDWLKKVEYWH